MIVIELIALRSASVKTRDQHTIKKKVKLFVVVKCSQFKDKDDILSIFVDLVQINDIGMFHLRQDMNLFLDIFASNASPRGLQSLLLDELGRIFMTRMPFQNAVNRGELTAEK